MKRSATRGEDAFRQFYQEAFGTRWEELEQALLGPKQYVARLNHFSPDPTSRLPNTAAPVSWHPKCFAIDGTVTIPTETTPLPFFLMDGASVLAADALGVEPGEDILDLCAAPGGKSLILAEKLGDNGTLTSNDRSAHRRERLKRVLTDYLPPNVMERVRVTGHDASRWCLHQQQAFDRILVDAPCSSERHVLHDPKELAQWTSARTKQLAQRQYAILASALQVVRVGGHIVYSTCALSERENDQVIARLIRKKKKQVQIVRPPQLIGEPTEHGHLILPDTTGFGPIFFSVIQRME